MPLDGTEFEAFGNGPLVKLGAVERLLINQNQWCKGRLRDKNGRFCLAGAMQAVEARQLLDPIILRAIREVGGKRYWRIESFNDYPSTTARTGKRHRRCDRRQSPSVARAMVTNLALFVLRAVVRHLGLTTLYNGPVSPECISRTLYRFAK